jgi:hypothetical protein
MFANMKHALRFWIGFAIVLIVAIAGFAIVIQAAVTWGATPTEASRRLPGDDLIADSLVNWDNAITIHAPIEQVWPWVAQLGDTRAGYYSYTFIEKGVMLAIGTSGAELNRYYNNADRIHPDWQNPAIGQGMIIDALKIHSYEPNHYLLANTNDGSGFVWNWGWYLEAIDAQTTRLQVRSRLQVPPAARSPFITVVFSAGGFIMEQNMIQGIAQRAEGAGEPANVETFEIILWLAALGAGLWCAYSFVFGRGELKALGLGLLVVAALFVLTYVQPDLWIRAIMDVALWAGAVLVTRPRS